MSFETLGFDDLEKELEQLGDIDDIAPVILEAAAPILKEELQSQVQQAADKGYAQGDLAGSIKANKPGENHLGHYVSVTAKGKDRKGIRNNEKLAYLNYGTSKQSAKPIISKAMKNSEKKCLDAMQEKFNEVTGG
ncbi:MULTISPECIES: HK97-gp10 family putative phage morphogenesis protein [Blautia]|uniref:HK97-gp10 family putative phage morphogenesis protein n=1 Tax=Blautia TaxID=572511 RepID=UPI0013905FA6|nr:MULTISPECIES: HK97-gp10 family putative phage morphogenesis protein [Blautia]